MDSFEALYHAHEPRVRWVIRGRGVDEAAVDDLVHESFVAIHRRLPGRDASVPLATWVSGVARNVAFSYRRTEARRRQQLRHLPAAQPSKTPDEVVAEREAWRALDAFARTLSPKLREVFLLCEAGGMPVHEAAVLIKAPVSTLHSRLRLARGRFAAHFGASAESDEGRAAIAKAADEQRATPAQQRRALALLAVAIDPKVLGRGATASAGAAGGVKVLAWGAAAVAVAGAVGLGVVRAGGDGATPQPDAEAVVAEADDLPVAKPPASENAALAGEEDGVPAALDTEARHARISAEPSASSAATTTSSASDPDPVDAPTIATSPSGAKRGRTRPTATRRLDAADAGTADPTDDARRLAEHVAALKAARSFQTAGKPERALAELAAVSQPHPSLARDHRRVELRAACAANEPAKARRAASALAKLGLPADPAHPCAPQKKSGPQ